MLDKGIAYFLEEKEQDSSASTVTRPEAGETGHFDRIPRMGRRFFPFPVHLKWFWGLHSFLFHQ
jgi:hypothetical protein